MIRIFPEKQNLQTITQLTFPAIFPIHIQSYGIINNVRTNPSHNVGTKLFHDLSFTQIQSENCRNYRT